MNLIAKSKLNTSKCKYIKDDFMPGLEIIFFLPDANPYANFIDSLAKSVHS